MASIQDRSGIKPTYNHGNLAPSMKKDRKAKPTPKQPPLGGLKRSPMSESEKKTYACYSINN